MDAEGSKQRTLVETLREVLRETLREALREAVIASGRSTRRTQGLTVVCFGILRLDYGGT